MADYYVYLLRCENGSLYTGVTTDPARRFRQHAGEITGGAKSMHMLRPLRFEALFLTAGRSAALSLEARLKRLSHRQKEEILTGKIPKDFSFLGAASVPIAADGRGAAPGKQKKPFAAAEGSDWIDELAAFDAMEEE